MIKTANLILLFMQKHAVKGTDLRNIDRHGRVNGIFYIHFILNCIFCFQWKMLTVMMFGADGLNSPKESVLVSVEPLMPLYVG